MKQLNKILETFKTAKHEQGIRKPNETGPEKVFKGNTIVSTKGKAPAASLASQEFIDDHEIEVTADANGNGDEVFKASNITTNDRKKTRHGYDSKESEAVYEMSKAQMTKREEIVKSMKKNFGDFKKRYGEDAKSVMYATATKQAMEEEVEEPAENTFDDILEAVHYHKEEQQLTEAYAQILELIYESYETEEEKQQFMALLETDDAFDELASLVEQALTEQVGE